MEQTKPWVPGPAERESHVGHGLAGLVGIVLIVLMVVLSVHVCMCVFVCVW